MKRLIYLLLFTWLITACSFDPPPPKTMNTSFSKEWKEDSTACLGLRRKILENYEETVFAFGGYSQKEFEQVFGKPSFLKDNILYYWIGCAKIPPIKSYKNDKLIINKREGINIDADCLVVELDIERKIRFISYHTP